MRRVVITLALPVVAFFPRAQAQDYHFDAALLGEAAKGADLSLFSQGLQQPGTYRLDIIVNGEQVDSRDIALHLIKRADGSSTLAPCLSVAWLSRWGVKTKAFPGLSQHSGSAACAHLAAMAGVSATVDVPGQQLRLAVPQASLRPQFGGLAPEVLWDDGMTAGLMNYSAGTSRSDSRGGSSKISAWYFFDSRNR